MNLSKLELAEKLHINGIYRDYIIDEVLGSLAKKFPEVDAEKLVFKSSGRIEETEMTYNFYEYEDILLKVVYEYGADGPFFVMWNIADKKEETYKNVKMYRKSVEQGKKNIEEIERSLEHERKKLFKNIDQLNTAYEEFIRVLEGS